MLWKYSSIAWRSNPNKLIFSVPAPDILGKDTLINIANDFFWLEEKSNFLHGIFFAVRSVYGVMINGCGKVGTNCTRCCFCRIRCTHDLTIQDNGITSLEYLYEYRA